MDVFLILIYLNVILDSSITTQSKDPVIIEIFYLFFNLTYPQCIYFICLSVLHFKYIILRRMDSFQTSINKLRFRLTINQLICHNFLKWPLVPYIPMLLQMYMLTFYLKLTFYLIHNPLI